ncbi:MAG: ribonuclease P protein subunit [Candidatus Thermoplasmatota archaeon]|jgi:RNase P/RNase MRP subunit p29|nr:ribonuclease P protein subunit [Candidatus Thermoplasmatota archaeon]
MGEFIGRRLRVTGAPGVGPLPLEGTVVDETLNMFYLSVPGRSGNLGVAKHGLEGFLESSEGETAFIGDAIRVRPEDRIKRYASRRNSR